MRHYLPSLPCSLPSNLFPTCIPTLQPGSYGTTGTTGTTGYGTTAATGTTGYGTTVGGEDVIERRTEEAAYEEAATTGRPAVAQTVTTAEAAPARAAPVAAGTEAVSHRGLVNSSSLGSGFAVGMWAIHVCPVAMGLGSGWVPGCTMLVVAVIVSACSGICRTSARHGRQGDRQALSPGPGSGFLRGPLCLTSSHLCLWLHGSAAQLPLWAMAVSLF